MDWKLFATVFGSVFVAELGDKTQLATMVFAANAQTSRWVIFFGSAAALVLTSALGVAAGSVLTQWISEKTLHWLAGLAFIAIGIWTLWRA
ncbi:MAG: TMEM165/GDT1 family protein [Planctomycetes bacterium]|nr:TMEM165/GDT1 family protein [Planctomycetota bacterium]